MHLFSLNRGRYLTGAHTQVCVCIYMVSKVEKGTEKEER